MLLCPVARWEGEFDEAKAWREFDTGVPQPEASPHQAYKTGKTGSLSKYKSIEAMHAFYRRRHPLH
ncbi:MAG: hypothetical protein ACAI35_03490 [Candidatus Methylacidiphilales bacterium]